MKKVKEKNWPSKKFEKKSGKNRDNNDPKITNEKRIRIL
ncbi:MAG: hypothetical protein RL264_582 [Bacteroidota bacterium]|jgi:predicted transcriptional regulator